MDLARGDEIVKLNSSKGGLVGILIIALVMSTLLVISLRREEVGSPVYLARNEYPPLFKSTESRGETMIFNFGIICKEPFKEVEIMYSNLFMTPEPEFDNAGFVANSSDPITIMERRKDIQAIKNNLGDVTIPFDVINVTARAGNLTHKKEYRGVIYDFTRTLALFLDKSILDQIFEVYAILKSDDGDLLYFAGVPDYFYDRSKNLKYLSIHYNQNETTYEAETDLSIDITPVEQAPRAGSLIFTNTDRDDQIFIQMNIEANFLSLPESAQQSEMRMYLIEYVRVYANGKLEVNELNLIPIEAGGWKA